MILSYGGRLAGPLFAWLALNAVFFALSRFVLVANQRAGNDQRKKYFSFGFLVIWFVHSFVVIYTVCQLYRVGWATNWSPGTEPSVAMLFQAASVCLTMALLSTGLLLASALEVSQKGRL